MKPLPYHLATPLWLENWHGVPVLPRTRKVLETPLRKLTPAVLYVSENNGAASRTCTGIPWLASRNPALERWPHFELNKNKHRCQSGDGLAPAGKFLGGSFGVSGTPPVA